MKCKFWPSFLLLNPRDTHSCKKLMTAIGLSSLSWPYELDRGYELLNSVHELWTFSSGSQLGHVRKSEHLRMDKTMELSFFVRNPPMTSLYLTSRTQTFQFPLAQSNQIRAYLLLSAPLYATMNSPRGFGSPPKKKRKKLKTGYDGDDDDDSDEEEGELEPDAGITPEVVTNRMMNRMGFTVGVPLFIGPLFFPFFYYLKVVLKIDVPT